MKRLFFLFISISLFANEDLFEGLNLYRDLSIIEKVDKKIHESLPLLFNYNQQVGYFTMPSARFRKQGVGGFGFSYAPPYSIYSLAFQPLSQLELTGNYYVYNNRPDKILGPLGFGNRADRTANIKVSLLNKEDHIDFLPQIAIGANDFFGSKAFTSYYGVLTKEFLEANLEASLGWGKGRIKGFFAGIAWSPFRSHNSALQNFTLAMEYDANDYKHNSNEHPDGKTVKFPINLGFQYNFLDYFSFSVNTLRGEKIAASASFNYNFGTSNGLFLKSKNPLPYIGPVNYEPFGRYRTKRLFAHKLAYSFSKQGLDLYSAKLIPSKKKQGLFLKVINMRYRKKQEVRSRSQKVLGALLPDDIDYVTLVIESDGLLTQQYCFSSSSLKKYYEDQTGDYEMEIISPMKEVKKVPCSYESVSLFQRRKNSWNFLFRPRFRSYFGSSRGKFKYDLSLIASMDGYLFNQVYYNLLTSYSLSSSMQNLGSCDILNPSKLIHVRSDTIQYHQTNSLHIENLYLQKGMNLGHGFFGRFAAGYFEPAYAGGALEFLYYPANSNWAIGIEVSTIKKRKYSGMGFFNTIEKFKDSCLVKVPFHCTTQCFLDFYYNYEAKNIDFQFSLGRFLAKDVGIKTQIGKTFKSGVRLYFWTTFTNGNDVVNGSRYYDKGVGFAIPLDFFLKKSSKKYIGYSISEWLRDVGAMANTGNRLYPIIHNERK